MEEKNKKSISVIGLGKLGFPLVLAFASREFNVVGVDVNENTINKINKGISPIYELGTKRLLKEHKNRIVATSSLESAIRATNISFVIVPTPSNIGGDFSLDYVLPICQNIGRLLKKKSKFHVVVVSSTVMTGSMDIIQKEIEICSEKICGKDFGLCYVPEFVALGSVIKNYLCPDFVLIGESDERSGKIIYELYKKLCLQNPPIIRTNYMNAELSKIALNVFVTMKISFANMLAEVCEKLPGGNVDNVTFAIGYDTRIGHRFLKGALGFGGRCFPRDQKSFSYLAEKVGIDPLLVLATDKINDRQVERIIQIVRDNLLRNGTVAVLGITFKPGTDVVTESQGLEIAQRLGNEGMKVCAYDPLVNNLNLAQILKTNMTAAFSIGCCIGDADIIVIANPCEEFRDINSDDLKDKIVIDCWRILEPEQYKDCRKYIAIGVNHEAN